MEERERERELAELLLAVILQHKQKLLIGWWHGDGSRGNWILELPPLFP